MFDNNPVYWSDPSGADAKGYMSGGKLIAAHFTGQEAIDAYNQLVNGTTASAIEIAVEMTYDTQIIPDGNGGGGDGGGWLSMAWHEVKSWFGGQSKSVTIGPFEEDSSNPFLIFWGDFTGASRVMQIHLEAQAVSTNSDGSMDWRGYAAYTLMQEKITNPGGLEIGRNLFGSSSIAAKEGTIIRRAVGAAPKGFSRFNSINQLNKLLQTGKLPKTITRFDKGKILGELDHVHFSNGAALNINGT